jgi:hypothetical protein
MLLCVTVAVTAAAAILTWWGGRERRRMERLAGMQKALGAEQESSHA